MLQRVAKVNKTEMPVGTLQDASEVKKETFCKKKIYIFLCVKLVIILFLHFKFSLISTLGKLQSEQHHRRVLLNVTCTSSFHLNGHTLGFHPQIQKLEPPCTA